MGVLDAGKREPNPHEELSSPDFKSGLTVCLIASPPTRDHAQHPGLGCQPGNQVLPAEIVCAAVSTKTPILRYSRLCNSQPPKGGGSLRDIWATIISSRRDLGFSHFPPDVEVGALPNLFLYILSDNLKIPCELPVRDGFAEFAFFPFAGLGVVGNEVRAEKFFCRF